MFYCVILTDAIENNDANTNMACYMNRKKPAFIRVLSTRKIFESRRNLVSNEYVVEYETRNYD